MAELVVTIDGPAGSGKSTVSRRLAGRLGATFLDTGAMYRAVTLAAMNDGIDLADEAQLIAVFDRHTFDFKAADQGMGVWVDRQDVTEAIRAPELTAHVRHVAAAGAVRARLVAMQRAFADRYAKVVTEGRDQGTVAFPDADVKFYLTADTGERARRRQAELDGKGAPADLTQIREAIEARDQSDASRAVGPLKPAADAIRFDTTDYTIDEVVQQLVQRIEERCSRND